MRTRSGTVFGRVCMLKANIGLSRLFDTAEFRYITICDTIQYMYKTEYALRHHASKYANVEEVHACIKVTFNEGFSSIPADSKEKNQ